MCLEPMCRKDCFWWLWSGCPPLPIPNREVKPRIADDTAHVRGKVGRRQAFTEESHTEAPLFFVFIDLIDSIDAIELIDAID